MIFQGWELAADFALEEEDLAPVYGHTLPFSAKVSVLPGVTRAFPCHRVLHISHGSKHNIVPRHVVPSLVNLLYISVH